GWLRTPPGGNSARRAPRPTTVPRPRRDGMRCMTRLLSQPSGGVVSAPTAWASGTKMGIDVLEHPVTRGRMMKFSRPRRWSAWEGGTTDHTDGTDKNRTTGIYPWYPCDPWFLLPRRS